MVIERILRPDDPRITIYRDLKDKHLHRDNAFIVEGKFILETLLNRSRFKTVSVLITEDRLEPLKHILMKAPENTLVYVTTSTIMAEIAGFDVHRGILAAGNADPLNSSLPANMAGLKRVAVLSSISNPDNIGAIFRNAAGLGIEAVFLDAHCCSPLYRKAIRVSMGATLVLPWTQDGSIADIIENLSSNGFSLYALSLQSASKLEDVEFKGSSAFVFGEEAYGLTPAVQSRCIAITIPMSAGTDSLNVAATSAIVFDAARRQQNSF